MLGPEGRGPGMVLSFTGPTPTPGLVLKDRGNEECPPNREGISRVATSLLLKTHQQKKKKKKKKEFPLLLSRSRTRVVSMTTQV